MGPALKTLRRLGVGLIIGLVLCSHPVMADETTIGPSGLAIPRYVSLKSDRVNVRKGPGTTYPIAWVFGRAGLPVEVIQEFDNWRQIRDSDGATGWVLHSLLSGRRTGIILPWEIKTADASASEPTGADIHESAATSSDVIAIAQPGTLASILSCDRSWCRIVIGERRGWIEQTKLWGVYKDETID